jgi:hypothetical protein
VRATLAAQEATDVTRIDRTRIERKVRECLDDWRERLTGGDVDRARQALREILVGPLTLTREGASFRFEGEASIGALIACRVGLPTFVARPDARATHGRRPRRRSGGLEIVAYRSSQGV